MSSNNTLRVSQSKLHAEFAGDSANYKKYEAQLKAIDKNGDGVIDINELCQTIDEMAQIEKQRRLLKWAAIITGLFALLTIAAVVGLVYAVVVLTKDTSVSSSGILTTKDSAATPIATGQVIQLDSVKNLYTKSLDDLSNLDFIIIPNDNGGRVIHVAEVELVANTSATVTTDAGNKFVIDAAGIHEVMKNGTAMRKLLNAVDGQGGYKAQGVSKESQYSACYQPCYDQNSPRCNSKCADESPSNKANCLDSCLFNVEDSCGTDCTCKVYFTKCGRDPLGYLGRYLG